MTAREAAEPGHGALLENGDSVLDAAILRLRHIKVREDDEEAEEAREDEKDPRTDRFLQQEPLSRGGKEWRRGLPGEGGSSDP